MAYQLLQAVKVVDAVSMGTDITSDVVEIKLQDNIGIQFHWEGTPTGDFDVQISANHKEDINGNVLEEGNWISLPLSPAISAAGSADDAYVDLNQMSAQYVRVFYDRTSGTGTLSVWIVGKAV